jgi:hypothetical protein
MDDEQRRHLEDVRQAHLRRLRELEKQAAIVGINTRPEVLTEIEDIQAKIAEIDTQIGVEVASSQVTRLVARPSDVSVGGNVGTVQTVAVSGGIIQGSIIGSVTTHSMPSSVSAALPSASLGAIPLTLRLVPDGDMARVIWEADILGRRASTFYPPYDAATLPLVIKALDSVQWPTHSADGSPFDRAERDRLAALGYWVGDRVVPDMHQRIGRALYDALTVDPEGTTALRIVRDHATTQGLPLDYVLRFRRRPSP